jgi:hypothetical protein
MVGWVRSCSNLLAALVLAGSSLACEAVLGAPDYRVDAARDTPELVELYATGPASCAGCLRGGACGEAFAGCAGDRECAEFAACLLERPSPVAEAECVIRERPPEAVIAATRVLSRCYAQCVGECDAGSDFRCAGAYGLPGSLPSSTIRVTQTLRFLLSPHKAVQGLEVSICRPGIACDEPLARAVTDDSGTYSAEIPISTAPISEAGFRGYRMVHGESGRLYPHRLESSRALLVDHSEFTGLASEEVSREVLPALGITDALNLVLLQAFDCRGVGAGGIFFELDSEEARVEYIRGTARWGEGPTVASQEGAAFATGVRPGAYHEVRAVTAEGELVARDSIYVPGDALVVAALFPREAE